MTRLLIFLICFSVHLRAQERPELVITNGHLQNIKCMDFHPQGKFIVTSSEDHSVKIWDIALKQEFRTLFGHNAGVEQVEYTHDGKYLVSMDRGGKVIFWDALNGQKLKVFNTVNINAPFSLSPNNNTMLVITPNDSITLLEVPSGKILSRIYSSYSEPFCLLASNKEYVATGHAKNGIAIYPVSGGDPIKEIEAGGIYTSRLIYHPADNLCALFSLTEIVVFDLSKMTIKVKIPFAASDLLKAIEFSGDGKKIIAATEFNKIILYNIESGKELLRINEFTRTPDFTKDYALCNGLNSVVMSPDNKLIAVNGQLTEMKKGRFSNRYVSIFYDAVTGKRAGMLEGAFKMLNGLALANDNKYLCTSVLNSFNSGIRFWNLKDGSIIKNIPGYASSFSKSSNKACVWYPPDSLTVFNANDFEKLKTLKIRFVQSARLSDDGSILVAATTNSANPLKMGIQVYETNKFTRLGAYEVDQRSFSLNTHLSPDGKYVIGVGRNNLDVRELVSGKSLPQKQVDYDMSKIVAFVQGGSLALVADFSYTSGQNSKLHLIDYVKGEEVGNFDVGSQNFVASAAFSADGKKLAVGSGVSFGGDFNINLFDWETRKQICSLSGHNNTIDYLSWNSDGTTLYSASSDGTAKSWDVTNCKEKGTFICMTGPEEYIIHSPDYYYKCSKGNYEGICFRYKNRLFRFDQFDIVLNRPDLVMEKLGSSKLLVGMYRQAWKKRIKRLGFTEEMLGGTLSLPDAMVEGKESIAQSGGKITFRVNASDESAGINRVNVYINNVPLYGIKGLDVSAGNPKTLTKEFSIALSNDINQIDVSVTNNKGLESAKESFRVDYPNADPGKPNLFIYAIGVSKFKDSKHNLNFPVKDANDFINALKSGTQFAKTEVEFIRDSSATKEQIIASTGLLQKAKINDLVVIYISSHGLLDTKLDYFIATNDVNFDEPAERGLPYEEIEKMLDKVACRNRLILIDACHSGEVDNEGVEVVSTNGNPNAAKVTSKSGNFGLKPKAGLNNSFAYMQALFSDVSKGSGATVISAAGGNEFALESKEWNNGVFTYSILKGLKSSEADRDKDKQIKISELKFYVIDMVSELTGGKQTPTARKENEVNDFIIFKK